MDSVSGPDAFGRSRHPWAFWQQKYKNATSEKALQAVLSEELLDAGYVVHSEVHCMLPLDGSGDGEYKRRRIDLWALRRQQAGVHQPLQNGRIMPGCAFGIELKFTKHHRQIQDWRTLCEQAKGGLRAHDWHTSHDGGRCVPRPQYMLVADNTTLLQDATFELAEIDRQLWSNGCSILHRDEHGGLNFRIHAARKQTLVQLTHHQHRAPFVPR